MAVPVLLPIGWFVLLVVGGVGVIARQPFCLYVLAAGNAALIASATRNTWDLLVFGRTKDLSERGALASRSFSPRSTHDRCLLTGFNLTRP